MNIFESDMFPYLDGEWVKDERPTLTIKSIAQEEIVNGDRRDTKFVIHFTETKKGLVLNKTNAKIIGKLYTGETDNWMGNRISLTTESVRAFGETHNAIRVVPKVPPAINTIPTNTTDFLAYVNARVQVPYDNAIHLLNAIKQDAPKFEWGLLAKGAQKAYDIAKKHADAKSTPVEMASQVQSTGTASPEAKAATAALFDDDQPDTGYSE